MEKLHFKLEMDIDPSMAFYPTDVLQKTLEYMCGRMAREVLIELKTKTDPVKASCSMTMHPTDVDRLDGPIQSKMFEIRVVDKC